jgi:hypothetical protein
MRKIVCTGEGKWLWRGPEEKKGFMDFGQSY